MIVWDSAPRRHSRVQLNETGRFDARGMRRVYGRGDRFGRMAAFNMDIWCDRNGILVARFWSRSEEVDDCSFVIRGLSLDAIPKRSKNESFSDDWIPKKLRDEYENWIISESPYR
jgi:hypothetical protein